MIVLDSAIFILFLLVISLKYELIQANAMKSVLILVISVVSLGVFIMKGEINWTAGLVLSAGSIIGSYVGSRFAVQEKSKVWIFRIIKMALLVELVPLVLRHL